MTFDEWWNNWSVKDWNDIESAKNLFKQAFEAGLHADVHTDNSKVIAELEEKLEKEAEEYARDTYEMCSYQGLPYASDRRARQQAFLAGAEPREKRIAELESTNKKISDECHKLVDSLEKKQNEIAELKEENQKWKDEWQEQVQKENDESYARTLQTMQLTKAKEIIKEILEEDNYSLGLPKELRLKTEQFIKDSEVEKWVNIPD